MSFFRKKDKTPPKEPDQMFKIAVFGEKDTTAKFIKTMAGSDVADQRTALTRTDLDGIRLNIYGSNSEANRTDQMMTYSRTDGAIILMDLSKQDFVTDATKDLQELNRVNRNGQERIVLVAINANGDKGKIKEAKSFADSQDFSCEVIAKDKEMKSVLKTLVENIKEYKSTMEGPGF